MRRMLFLLSTLALTGLMLSGGRAAAEDAKPLAVISLSGYDALLQDLDRVGEIAGSPGLSKIAAGMVQQFTQGQGLAGLDQKQPWGAAIQLAADQSPLYYGFVPVSDPKKLLEVLKPFLEDVQESAGTFTVKSHGQTWLLKAKGHWTYITANPAWLDQVAADPGQLLGDLPKRYLAAVALHVANIPQAYREMAVNIMQMSMQAALQKSQPGESDEDRQTKRKLAEKGLKSIVQAVNDLDTVTLGLSVDPSARKLALDLAIVAKAGTATARDMATSAKYETEFAGLQIPAAALTLASGGKLSEGDVQQSLQVVHATRDKLLKQLEGQQAAITPEQFTKGKKIVADVFSIADDTLNSGYQDAGLTLLLDPKTATLAAAGHVVGGAKLEQALKDAVALIAADQPDVKSIVKFDAETYKGVRLHTLSKPIPEDAANRQQLVDLIGPNLDVVLGVNDKAVYVTAGRNALETIKQVIDKSAAAGKVGLPPLRLALAMTPLLNFAAQMNPQAGMMAGIGAGILATAPGKDHLNLTATPVANGLQVRLEVEEGLIKLLGLVLPHQQGG